MKNKVKYPSPPTGKAKDMSYPLVERQIRFLQGKILTVVDASYQDPVQRKAVKDLMNSAFSEQLVVVSNYCMPEFHVMSRDSAASLMGVEEIEKAEDEAESVSK